MQVKEMLIPVQYFCRNIIIFFKNLITCTIPERKQGEYRVLVNWPSLLLFCNTFVPSFETLGAPPQWDTKANVEAGQFSFLSQELPELEKLKQIIIKKNKIKKIAD